MLNFQAETWSDVVEEMKLLFPRHWHEIGVDREAIPMDMDYDWYADLERFGKLDVLTARADGKLVGYYVSLLSTGLHYRQTVFGVNDMFYLAPEFRNGPQGIRLLIEMEKRMRAIGARKLVANVKLDHDVSPLFLRLGWKPTETVLTKVLD